MPDDSRVPGHVTETVTMDFSTLPKMRIDGSETVFPSDVTLEGS